jgi:predicted P-loop ATPase
MLMRGKLIVEFSELSGMAKKDANAIKSFITRSTDEFRAPYARVPERQPRQCIFAGSINDDQYLTDPTGGRRFWPVLCSGDIDIKALKRDREQLWAEAVDNYNKTRKWWIESDDPVWETAQDEQRKRTVSDIWEEQVLDFIEDKTTVRVDVIMNYLQITPKDRNNFNAKRVGDILRKLDWVNTVTRDAKTKRTRRVWVNYENLEKENDND